MKKNKKNTRIPLPVKKIAISRYTYNAWMKCYPESNYAEWEEITMPNNLLDYLENLIISLEENYTNLENVTYQISTINDKYFKWLEENHLENTQESRQEYASKMTEETAYRILKEENMDKTYGLFSLIIAGVNDTPFNETNFKLTKELSKELENYLKEIFDTYDIYVPGYVLKAETLLEYKDRLINLGKAYFEQKTNVKIGYLDTQEFQDEINASLFFIPIIFKQDIKKAAFNYNDILGHEEFLYKRYPDLLFMSEEGFESFKIKDIKPLEDSILDKNIQKALNCSQIDVIANLCDEYHIIESVEAFIDVLRNQGAKII